MCNWMSPQNKRDTFCVSCRLEEIIPDLSNEQNRSLWARIENAKRRLVNSLIRLNLPIQSKKDDPQQGVAFRFLSDVANPMGGTSIVICRIKQVKHAVRLSFIGQPCSMRVTYTL